MTVPTQLEGVAEPVNCTEVPGTAPAGAEALHDSEQVVAPTVTETWPRFESVEPSHAAYVNESWPENPANGKYVAVVPDKPTVPLAGWETMRSVSGSPLTSLASRWIATGAPAPVAAVRSLTTAGELWLPSSLDGPLWHV